MAQGRAWPIVTACVLSFAACSPLAAQTESTGRIPWVFAPLLGTGRYEITDDVVVQALSYAPRRRFSAAELETPAGRRVGIELHMPFTVSTYDTDLTGFSSLRLDNVGTFSAVPGIEIDVPVSRRLSVKPLVYAGLGKEFHGGPTARIFWAGVKARVSWMAAGLGVDLITSIRYAGFAASDDASGDIVPLRTGLELTKPMRDRTIGDDPLNWYWHVAHTNYLDDEAGEALAPRRPTVEDEWELGVAFGKRGERLRLGRLGWDRVGVALTFDASASPTGVRLVFRSLYDR